MLELKTVGLVVGILLLVFGSCGLLSPALSRKLLAGFPRNRAAACLLTAVVLGWAFWLLYNATFLAGLPVVRKVVLVVAPVSYLLVIMFLDELLAARSLGGLLLLLPQLVLRATFPHDQSEWRFVLTTLAYVWVIAGIVLLLSPYYFRRTATLLAGNDGKCRGVGLVIAVGGATIIALAMTVY